MSRRVQRFRFLTEDELETLHGASLQVLEKAGIMVKNADACKLLSEAGCEVESQIARIPPSLVEECLTKAPSSIKLYTRDGNNHFVVGGDNIIYNPGSAAIYFLDEQDSRMRKGLSRDLVRLVRLVDGLEHLHAQSTALVPSDVSETISDLYRLYIILKNSTKPVVTGAFTKEGLIDMKRMLEAVAGGEKDLASAPRAIFDVCPSSPLMWSDVTCQNLIDCSRFSIPAEIVPAPQMGATSPVSLFGTLVQSNAEILSGIVISQLVKKGAPIIYGGSPAAFDMRYCTARLGAIESIIVAIAGAEIGKSYGLPTHSYLGLSDSKIVDAQGGFESGLGIVFAALAGVNIVSGPGMLASENCQSLEKLVIDNEVCGMAYRILEGISTTCVEAVVDLIARVGSGGHFLGERHTRENLRKEHLIPSEVVDRMTLDAWTKSGSKDTVKRAKERVDSILKEHVPTPLSAEAEVRLDNVFKEIIARHGLLSSLAVSSPDKEESS